MDPIEFALKEWAVVCAALAAGRQHVLVRKGGIAEGPDGFEVQHDRFWLMPTRFHQSSDEIVPEAQDLFEDVKAPAAGTLELPSFATVDSVVRLDDERRLPELTGLHVLSPDVLAGRFRYREPGLFVMLVRVFVRSEPIVIPDSPHFTGCHSWVDLPEAIDTTGCVPAVGDETFLAVRNEFERATQPPSYL